MAPASAALRRHLHEVRHRLGSGNDRWFHALLLAPLLALDLGDAVGTSYSLHLPPPPLLALEPSKGFNKI